MKKLMSLPGNVPEALERVYHVFSSVKTPLAIDACPCCLDQAEVQLLISTPLREIAPRQLAGYASSVFLTVGSVDDFRYFLPRILDIVIHELGWWPSPEVVLRSLASAQWRQWGADEQAALKALFDAIFDDVMRIPEDPEADVDAWICALALAGMDVMPYLRRLEEAGAETVLCAYVGWNAAELSENRLSNGFWEGQDDAAATVLAWFASPAVQAVLCRRGSSA